MPLGFSTFGGGPIGVGAYQSAIVLEPAPTVTGVAVTPSGAVLLGAGLRQYLAEVTGENNPPDGVIWSTTLGAIDAAGLLEAPPAEASAQTGAVTATSIYDPTKSGTVQFMVTALPAEQAPTILGVRITPPTAFVAGGDTAQFNAEVLGENNPPQTVTWATTLGSVDALGVVTAPAATLSIQQGTLTATSTEDTDISASINFNVLPLMEAFTPSAARTVRILPGRSAFAVGSHWTLGSAGPVGAKDPNSTIDIPFDWSVWLADIGGAQLAQVEFFLSGNLQSEGVIPNATGGTVLVSGGAPKGTATITCRITTATTPARTDDRTVVLQIGEQ